MSEFTPWLGICHLRQVADASLDTRPALAAVWANSVESFERELHVHTNSHGQQMIWAEDAMPASEWLVEHPARKDGQRLAAKVSAKHLVEIGGLGAGVTGTGAEGLPDGEDESYLHIEEIEGVEPLDMQFGVHPPKTVPDALYEPLFGQPDPTAAEVAQYGCEDAVPPLNTYAILDAAKVVNFVEMLEASGLEHRCLFKGAATEEMRDVAPYVVRLEEDVDFTRNLFSHDPEQEVPWFIWDREPGIYVRSRGSLDDMWKHFRKFTKVQDEDGKWFYFRFWEAQTSRIYYSGLAERSDTIAQWFQLSDGQHINTLLIRHAVKSVMVVIRPKELPNAPRHSRSYCQLTHEDILALTRAKTECHLDQLQQLLIKTFPDKTREMSNDELHKVTYCTVSRMQDYGFRQRDHLFRLLSWELFRGPNFEIGDSEGQLYSICSGQREETERMELLANRMRVLG